MKLELWIKLDGNMWFCHGVDYINLHESIVGWGETEDEAIRDYIRQIYT